MKIKENAHKLNHVIKIASNTVLYNMIARSYNREYIAES